MGMHSNTYGTGRTDVPTSDTVWFFRCGQYSTNTASWIMRPSHGGFENNDFGEWRERCGNIAKRIRKV